jgi:hypothetical protein
MQIGILTYYYALNYGAVLQAFALQKHLESLGHQVEFIAYQNPQIVESYRLFKFHEYSKRHISLFFNKLLSDIYTKIKYNKFTKNVNLLLNISSKIQTPNHYNLHKYDLIVVGSDQLWNKIITKGYDFFYCAQFNKSHKYRVVGYAISINTKSISNEEESKLASIIQCFDTLSLRESASVELLSKYSAQKIYSSIDPTFLIAKIQWKKYLRPVLETNYICVYPILNSEKIIERSRHIATMLGKQLVILNPIANCEYTNNNKNNPLDFVSYIANADIVLTSSFHGTAFTIIMEKNFYVLGDDKRNVRMSSFLSQLGLEDRIIDFDYMPDINNTPHYEQVNQKLSPIIENSKYYIKTILNN